MKTNYLFPNNYKKIGWLLFIPGLILGVFYFIHQADIEFFNVHVFAIADKPFMDKMLFFKFVENNVFDEIIGVLLIAGALLIAFSKEKLEDEFIAKIRLESLVWATYINYAILIFTIIFVYDLIFFWVLVLNMFTLLFLFLIRFNWTLTKAKNQLGDEE